MSNEIKRMNYFNGLLLKEDDLTLEQDYHVKLQRLHNRYFHDFGIVYGLAVTKAPGNAMVNVSQGLALNRITDENSNEQYSQEIFICDGHPDNPVNLSELNVDTDIYITVSYKEEETDVDTIKGGNKNIHIWERAQINTSYKLPDDRSKEIVLARVRLKKVNGAVVIDEVSNFEADGKTELRKNAVTEGNAQKFAQISIGNNSNAELPYINGAVDKTIAETDGLQIHTPFIKIPGTIASGNINTQGDIKVNGILNVTTNNIKALDIDSKGDITIQKSVAVGGTLSSSDGLKVSGTNTKIDTTNVEMTGNILSMNNYTPDNGELTPRKVNSGIEVFRGTGTPKAKLLWDESKSTWVAGTEGNDIYEIAYGESWEKMHNGAIVDDLHKHSDVSDSNGNVALTVDSSGNIDVAKSMVVSGSIVAKNGIEAPSDGLTDTAKIAWNETTDHWQIGTGDNMYDIPYGTNWDKLTTGENADNLHTHSEFYYNNTDLAMRVGPTGDVNVLHNLEVSKDLVVSGNMTVLGTTTEYTNKAQVVTENVVIVNKPGNGGQPVSEGGLEVYRGESLPNARIIWDEGSNHWKIGSGNSMAELPDGYEFEYLTHGGNSDNLHKHSSLFTEGGNSAVTAEGTDSVNVSVNGDLTVNNNANVSGEMSVDGSMTVNGNLTVKGTQTILKEKTIEVDKNVIVVNKYGEQTDPIQNEGGLEVYRGGIESNARLVWNEEQAKWKISNGITTYDLPYGRNWESLTQKALADGLHLHSILSDKDGKTAVTVNTSSVNIPRNTNIDGELNVDGTVTINGNLNVVGMPTFVNKVDMQVTDNTILLNKYEGGTSPVNESGIEIYRGSSPAARMIWDETAKTWKAGIGEELKEIASGSAWDTLKGHGNADALHIHGQLYNEKGDVLSLSTRASGGIDIAHDLNVGQDLTVDGNVDIRGELTRIDSDSVEMTGNILVINRFDSGTAPEIQSGISVFRGNDSTGKSIGDANILWDETNDYWKIGLSNASTVLKVKGDGSIQTPAVSVDGQITAGNANISGTLTVQNGIEVYRPNESKARINWNEVSKQWVIGTAAKPIINAAENGYVGIGNISPTQKLDVDGNAVFSGAINVGSNANITETIKTKNAEVSGDLKVDGTIKINQNNGIVVQRDNDQPAAKIYWDEEKDVWKFGVDGNMGEIVLNAVHNHDSIYSPDKTEILLKTDTSDSKKSVKILCDTIVSGNIMTYQGFQVARGGKLPAQLYWDEDNTVWKAGCNGILNEIVLSDHKHNCLYDSEDRSVCLSINSYGNVSIGNVQNHNARLNVDGAINATSIACTSNVESGGIVKGVDADFSGKLVAGSAVLTNDLTVGGNLTVSGEVVTVNTTTVDVEDNIITINKYAPQTTPIQKNAGIEVFRGGTENNAQIIWDEGNRIWQAGTSNDLKPLGYRDHTHPITDATTVVSGNIGIGKAPTVKLDVNGDTAISGNLTAADAIICGKMTAASAGITGDLTAANAIMSGKLTAASAGITGDLTAANAVMSGKLTAVSAGITGDLTVDTGKVGIGTAAPVAKLDVKGDTAISGKLTAASAGITGDLTAANAIMSGKLTAASAGITGDLTAANAIMSGKLTAASAGITGDLTVNTGKIGIGTTAPTAKLDVKGDTAISGKLTAASTVLSGNLTAADAIICGKLTATSAGITGELTAANAIMSGTLTAANAVITGSLSASKGIEVAADATSKAKIIWDNTNKKWIYGTAEAVTGVEYVEAMKVATTGNIGIGMDPDSTIKLIVNGDVKANNITQGSSRTIKDNIEKLPVKTAMELLNKLNPVSFDYKVNTSKKHNIGFIAEDVPEIFSTSDGKAIALMDIIGVLTAVVKKQQKESKTMQKQLTDLQRQVAAMGV